MAIPSWATLPAVVLSAVLFVLAFPDVSWSPLALVALAPWWGVWLAGPLRARRGFLLGWLWGLFFWGGLLRWLLNLVVFPWHAWIAGTLYCSLWPALFGALYTAFARRVEREVALLWLPLAWTAFEYLRSLGPLGFPWGTLGTTQWANILWLQSADLFSFYGLSLVLALSNATLAAFLLRHHWRWLRLNLTVLLLMLLTLYGLVRRDQVMQEALRSPLTPPIALLQGNFAEEEKTAPTVIADAWDVYSRQTRAAARQGAQLIILPETAFPLAIADDHWLAEAWAELARETGTCILVGVITQPEPGRFFNSLIAYGPNGREEARYSKVRLLVFGEFVPWRRYFPFLGRFSLHDPDYTPGPGWHPMATSQGQLGAMICYESIFPYIGRLTALRGAELLVVVTNDAWFGPSAAAMQHASLAVFRAVETRRPLVRAANTGISGFIQPWGGFWPRSGLFTEEIVISLLPRFAAPTLYLFWGDVLPLLCGLLFVGRWVGSAVAGRESG